MISRDQMRTRLLAAIQSAGGQSGFARQCEVTRGYVSDLARGKREPGPKVLRVLKLRRVETKQIGYEAVSSGAVREKKGNP